MSPTGRIPHEIVEEAPYHLQAVVEYLDAEPITRGTTDAIAMRLSAALDAMSALPEDLRDRITGGEGTQMWGMRNRLAHGYALTDGTRPHGLTPSWIPASSIRTPLDIGSMRRI